MSALLHPVGPRDRHALSCAAIAAFVLYLSPPLLAATPVAPSGANFSTRCAGCHSTQAGKNGVGPALSGVYGRTSGTTPGYTYSPAMKNAKILWDDQTLDKFLKNPSGTVHGTKMFASVPDAASRQQIIAYLQTLEPQSGGK